MIKGENVVAIVVTYNRKEMLKACIEAIMKSTYKTDIMIIDNASSDGTKEEIQNKYKDKKFIYYYNTGKNLGGAGGFQYGIRMAYAKGYEYFWLMDDDTIVTANALEKLMDAKEILNNNVGFLSSLALWKDGKICSMNYHGIDEKWEKDKIFCQQGIVRIRAATFVSFLISKDIVRKVGLPIKEYFIWGDDTEYSLRISKMLPGYLVSNSEVIHMMKTNQGTGSFGEIADLDRVKRISISIRNDCHTYKKNGVKDFVIYSAHILIKEPIAIMRTKKPYKGKKMKAILIGYLKGLFFHLELNTLIIKRKWEVMKKIQGLIIIFVALLLWLPPML